MCPLSVLPLSKVPAFPVLTTGLLGGGHEIRQEGLIKVYQREDSTKGSGPTQGWLGQGEEGLLVVELSEGSDGENEGSVQAT